MIFAGPINISRPFLLSVLHNAIYFLRLGVSFICIFETKHAPRTLDCVGIFLYLLPYRWQIVCIHVENESVPSFRMDPSKMRISQNYTSTYVNVVGLVTVPSTTVSFDLCLSRVPTFRICSFFLCLILLVLLSRHFSINVSITETRRPTDCRSE